LESVIYGGSVNKSNALDLFEQKNIDGALIGGASLDGKDFALIANIFNKLKV
jgi:triosephosphate isomerase